MSADKSPGKPADWLASVQVLRGLAALSVVCFHSINAAHRAHPNIPRVPVLVSGVDLFFLISGFVMVHVTRNRVGQPGAAWAFLHNRIIRVVPLYWFYTLAMMVAMALVPGLFRTQALNLPQALHSFLFWPDTRGPYVQVGWTLNFEMFFYLCFALCFDRTWKKLLVLMPVLAFGGLWGLTHPDAPRLGLAALALSPYLLEFLGGTIIATLYHSRFKLPGWLPWLGLVASVSVFAMFGVFRLEAHPVARWGLPLFFALAIAVRNEPVFRHRWASGLLWLGDASYSLYLIHFFVVAALEKLWVHRLGAAHPIVFIVVAASTCVIVVYPLWRWVEQPLLRACRRLWPLRPRPVTA